MTSNEFVYWLQGMMEIGQPKKLDAEQTQIIKAHLALVLNKVTPDVSLSKKDPRRVMLTEDPTDFTPATAEHMSPTYCFDTGHKLC